MKFLRDNAEPNSAMWSADNVPDKRAPERMERVLASWVKSNTLMAEPSFEKFLTLSEEPRSM
jgi:hypothetical protein